ncbi:MAG TPA: ornithine cyclodeaminase family protein [Vicinamibacterales bacterium]|nr:ornithine cyclodeaminase family protein [Vicinamibacterales bacterium]
MAVLLGEADVRQLLRMPDLIEAMEAALRAYSSGLTEQPLRTVLRTGEDMSFFGVMPAFQREPAALGTKIVTVCPANAAKGLPTHLATILLMDPSTGELVAVLDGRYITEARTAAVSAAATRALAREDASVLAILGSGVQAHSHLEAIGLVRRLREVRVWSPTPANRERFVAEHQGAAARVVASPFARAATDGADLIVTATASALPVLRREWVADGAHICAVGACRPDVRELETDLVAASRVYVDSRPGALAEAGDIVIPIEGGRFTADGIVGELGELFAGRVEGRRSPGEITLFKSLGMAIEDVAAAHLVHRRAAEVGLGRGFVL